MYDDRSRNDCALLILMAFCLNVFTRDVYMYVVYGSTGMDLHAMGYIMYGTKSPAGVYKWLLRCIKISGV